MGQGNSKRAKDREKSHEAWNRNPGHAPQSERAAGGYAAAVERKPLEWKEVHTQRRGKAIASVSAATNARNETIYSVRFSRLGKDDKPGGYFQINDLKDLEMLTSEVNVYIAGLSSGNGAGNGETAQDQPN